MKGPLGKDEVISKKGFVSSHVGKGLGVQRRSNQESSTVGSIVYKEVHGLQAAKRAIQNYKQLKEAGIPVAPVTKIIKRKEDGKDEYYIAMSDLTENDKYQVIEISDVSSQTGLFLDRDIQRRLLVSLAHMHNAGLVDFHPGLSIIIRREPNSGKVHDFVYIDYDNFGDQAFLSRAYHSHNEEKLRDLKTLITATSMPNNPDSLTEDEMWLVYKEAQQFPETQPLK